MQKLDIFAINQLLCLTVNINYTVLTAQWDYLPKISFTLMQDMM